MDFLTAAAASGMRARMETLDLLANNMANSSASGYKADHDFYSLYVSAEAADSTDGGERAVLPVLERQWTDFSQGALTLTDNPLDLAISGRGFFVAASPSGPLLTRAGSFKISPNGMLQTQDGLDVRAQDGKSIQVDKSRPVEVTPDGAVRQDGQEVARLDVVDVADRAMLRKHGLNYFDISSTGLSPFPAAGVQVEQGKLETANVQPAEAAVRLVTVMRQFESLQRALSIGAEMNRRAVEEVAKV